MDPPGGGRDSNPKPGKPETDVLAFTGLQEPSVAVPVRALCTGNNPVVVIFKDTESTNILTEMCFFFSFSENLILEVPAVKIHSLLE